MSEVKCGTTTVFEDLRSESSRRDSESARAIDGLGRGVSSGLNDLRSEVFDSLTAHSVTLNRELAVMSHDVTAAINRLTAAVLLLTLVAALLAGCEVAL